MSVNFFRAKVRLWPLVVVPTMVLGALVALLATGTLSVSSLAAFLRSDPSVKSSEVINRVLPRQEVALVSLRIEGLERADGEGDFFGIPGVSIPASGRLVYIEYVFDAKLGIDGSAVQIERDDENSYTVSIPEFVFIGHSNEYFSDPIEDNGVLSWLTEEISQPDMINNILSTEKKDDYVANSIELLRDQSEAFYSSIIHSVDADAVLVFEYATGDAQ